MLVNILLKTCRPLVVADQHSPLRWRRPFRDVNRERECPARSCTAHGLRERHSVPGAVVGHVSASTTPPPPCALIPTPARLWLRRVMSITLSMARTGTRRLKECRCEPVRSSAREAR